MLYVGPVEVGILFFSFFFLSVYVYFLNCYSFVFQDGNTALFNLDDEYSACMNNSSRGSLPNEYGSLMSASTRISYPQSKTPCPHGGSEDDLNVGYFDEVKSCTLTL